MVPFVFVAMGFDWERKKEFHEMGLTFDFYGGSSAKIRIRECRFKGIRWKAFLHQGGEPTKNWAHMYTVGCRS